MSASSRARWWNPTNGAFTTIGTYANTGTHAFTPPGDNGTGFDDWVLVLDTGASSPVPNPPTNLTVL
jgi:hypothetical protein